MFWQWTLYLFVSLGIVTATILPEGKKNCRSEFLQELGDEFPLVKSAHQIYDAGGNYVLQPRCTAGGELAEMAVVPRHYFKDLDPEWQEPDESDDLSGQAYDELINRIDKVRPIGRLRDVGKLSVVTNNRAPRLFCYDNAVIERVSRIDLRKSEEPSELILSFRVLFFRLVSGILKDKSDRSPLGIHDGYRVRIGDEWFLTTRDEFQGLEIHKKVVIRAVGPI